MLAVLAGLPRGVLRLAFGPSVAEQGASSLRVLSIGQGAFALVVVSTWIGMAVTALLLRALLRRGAGPEERRDA